MAEQLSRETVLMEEALIKNLKLAKELGLPKEIIKALKRLENYQRNRHIRLMRFDFHPTEDGWAVSEVNSDVPGGFAEASVLPEIASEYFNGCGVHKNFAESMLQAFKSRIGDIGTVAFVHATSYADDRQVMQFLSDYFNENGMDTVFAAPDLINWVDKKAVSIVKGKECNVDGIVRFFPLEWLVNLPKKSNWKEYYDCEIPSCNHPVSIFAQSKRLPLIWDKLGIEIPAWKKLLPETVNPKLMKKQVEGWIFKPALGRVGEGISIKEAITEKEFIKIQKAVRKRPYDWIAQKKFISKPLIAENNESYHLCVGVFTIDCKAAGFYARISPYPRIDSNAMDVPVLVEKN